MNLSFDICIDVITKINKQTCQVELIAAISVIDTKIDKDDTNYLIFQVFFPLQTSEKRHERLFQPVWCEDLGVYIMMLIRYI